MSLNYYLEQLDRDVNDEESIAKVSEIVGQLVTKATELAYKQKKEGHKEKIKKSLENSESKADATHSRSHSRRFSQAPIIAQELKQEGKGTLAIEAFEVGGFSQD